MILGYALPPEDGCAAANDSNDKTRYSEKAPFERTQEKITILWGVLYPSFVSRSDKKGKKKKAKPKKDRIQSVIHGNKRGFEKTAKLERSHSLSLIKISR